MRQGLADLAVRLQARRSEIEETALSRAHAVSDPADVGDPLYVAGLRVAVSAAVGFGIAALRKGEERHDPVPSALLSQARNAARRGVPLKTVMRRYLAGHTLLGEFILSEAEAVSLPSRELQEALRIEGIVLDHLIDTVAGEYQAEAENRSRSSQRRRAERVEWLLGGDLSEAPEFIYDFDGWHVGAVVAGIESGEMLQALAASLDRRLLLVHCGGGTAWAWLGGDREVRPEEMAQLAAASWPSGSRVALGEPERSLTGWRLTHRQAAAALPVAMRRSASPIRYGDVALLAATLADETLVSSLRRLYLQPLSTERDGGAALRDTLRAYFDSERALSSAAAMLGVSRHTVANRIRTVEQLVGRPLGTCGAQLEIALLLEELADISATETVTQHIV